MRCSDRWQKLVVAGRTLRRRNGCSCAAVATDLRLPASLALGAHQYPAGQVHHLYSQGAATLTHESGQPNLAHVFWHKMMRWFSDYCSRRTERRSSMMALFSASCFSKSSRSAASAPPSVALPNSCTALNAIRQFLKSRDFSCAETQFAKRLV